MSYSCGAPRAATTDNDKRKPTLERSKVKKLRPRAMSQGAQRTDPDDDDAQDVTASLPEDRKAREVKIEAHGPGNPTNSSRTLTTTSQAISFRFMKTNSAPSGDIAGQQRPEKQAADVAFRMSPKEHPRMLQLERENQELRTRLKLLSNPPSTAQSITSAEKEEQLAQLPTEDAQSAGRASKERSQAAERISALEDTLAQERLQAEEKVTTLQSELGKEKAKSSTIPKLENLIQGLRKDNQIAEQRGRAAEHDLSAAERENERLCTQIENSKRMIQRYKEQYLREKESKEKLDRELSGLTRQYKSLQKDRSNLHEDWVSKERKLSAQSQEMLTLRKRVQYLVEASQQADSEIEKLRVHNEQQELSVTKAQNAAMNVLSHSLSAALPDDRIKARFKELFESIAEWARENATEDRTIFDNEENIARWHRFNLLRHVGEARAHPNLEFDTGDDTAIDTLLNAAVARRLCQDFLRNPFWFAEDSSPIADVNLPTDERRLDTDIALERLMKKMMIHHDGSQAQVHAWRALTVKTLAGSEIAQERIQKGYRKYMEDELLDFCEGLVRPNIEQGAKEDLLSVVAAFGNFAIELWSQKYQVHYYCLNIFEDKVYTESDEQMELARAVGVEDGDTSLDGRPIPCVVQPLILGFGSNDGRDYDKSRVWSKAVVWVSKDGKPAPVQAAKSRRWL